MSTEIYLYFIMQYWTIPYLVIIKVMTPSSSSWSETSNYYSSPAREWILFIQLVLKPHLGWQFCRAAGYRSMMVTIFAVFFLLGNNEFQETIVKGIGEAFHVLISVSETSTTVILLISTLHLFNSYINWAEQTMQSLTD